MILRTQLDERAEGCGWLNGMVFMFASPPAQSRLGYSLVLPVGVVGWLLLASPDEGPTLPAAGTLPQAREKGRTEQTMIVAARLRRWGVG